MKKPIFLSFVGVLFLAGCGNIVSPVLQEKISTPKKEVIVNIMDINSKAISYKVPSHIFTGSLTGIFKKTPLYADLPDNDETDLMIGHSSMTGNMYTYDFPDVGMTFTFADIAASYFNPKDPSYFEPFMYYSGNTVFYGNPKDMSHQFVAIFSKDTHTNIVDSIKKDHAPLLQNGCTPKLREGNLTVFSGSEGNEIYFLEKDDSEMCLLGTFFITNKNQSDKYYMLSYADACAPSCNTFTNIEFF